MLNSLVLTRWRPDDRSGGAALRSTQNIRALASLGSVDVISLGIADRASQIGGVREWTPVAMPRPTGLDRFGARSWVLHPREYPTAQRYYSPVVAGALHSVMSARRYDVGVIENIVLAPYLRALKALAGRVVYDAHNAESALQATMMAARGDRRLLGHLRDRLLHHRMASVEGRLIREVDVVWACSEIDAVELAGAFRPAAPITVVPNGVDVDAYRPAGTLGADAEWSRLPITLVYPGLFGYPPNEAAALELITTVLPAVRAHGQAARLVLVGRGPTPAMLQAAQRQSGVEVTGEVETIVPYLQQPCVVVLPIRFGSGTRLKIVEAFAAGRPVVTTAKGVEGIDALDGQHLLIREDPLALASAVVRLWGKPRLRAMLCDNALELVRRRYSWRVAETCIARSLGLTFGGVRGSYDIPSRHLRIVQGKVSRP